MQGFRAPGPEAQGASLRACLAHADWSVAPAKRWAAWATPLERGWRVDALAPVGELADFRRRLLDISRLIPVLAGFDFPIGLPHAYGEKTGAAGFRDFLTSMEGPDWARFSAVAGEPGEIGIGRPFYPASARAGVRRASLVSGHGVEDFTDLLRVCERATGTRRAACPLFWTLGGAQVGRAALSGWEGVVRPLIGEGARLWPYDGDLEQLCERPGVVLAETYPAEACGQIGVALGARQSKRRREDRLLQVPRILEWAGERGVEFAGAVRAVLEDGFGERPDGEDRFDALIGLLGMIRWPAAQGGKAKRRPGWRPGRAGSWDRPLRGGEQARGAARRGSRAAHSCGVSAVGETWAVKASAGQDHVGVRVVLRL